MGCGAARYAPFLFLVYKKEQSLYFYKLCSPAVDEIAAAFKTFAAESAFFGVPGDSSSAEARPAAGTILRT